MKVGRLSFILVYVMNPTKKEAEKIAMHLLERRLVACAKIFPVESAYWWKGKLEKTKEYLLFLETIEENFEEIKSGVKKTHPYSVPCVTKINAEANDDFEKWVRREVR